MDDNVRSASPAALEDVDEAPVTKTQIPLNRRMTIRAQTLNRPTRAPTVHLPSPSVQHQSGMGGFGVSTQIARRLAQLLPHRQIHNGPAVLTREKPYSPDDGSSVSSASSVSIAHRVARWLPEGMEHLIIGRNGRFYTEELEDEELEIIGGVEYRALRFLSYFVPIVSDTCCN